MNKNRIEGRYGTTSWHNTAKSSGLPVEVNAAVVQGSIVPLPGEISPARAVEKSAEAIVVGETSRGRDARVNNDTGSLTQRRAEPNGSALTALRTVVAENARRRGDAESRSDGKHVGAQERASACFLTRACPASERNRRVRTRTHGGVGPVAGSQSQSRGPDSAILIGSNGVRGCRLNWWQASSSSQSWPRDQQPTVAPPRQ
jgi:hypothetical protein